MAIDAPVGYGVKPRGRPRVQTTRPMVRRNLLLDPADLARLRVLYQATSDSAAVRQALDAVLMWHDMDQVAGRIAASGGPDDVYHRTGGEPALPLHFDPNLVTEEDKIRYADSPTLHR